MEKIFKGTLSFDEFGYEGLNVYRSAFQLAMDIFEISKSFPKEEKYALTDQVRRSSRSVCANIAEGYRKRVYPKSFASKVFDSDGECSETMVHLKFACSCRYISQDEFQYFATKYNEVGRILNNMFQHPEKFIQRKEISTTGRIETKKISQ